MSASTASSNGAQPHETIQSDYAQFTGEAAAARDIKATTDALKPLRPPTAPAADIEAEKRAIVFGKNPTLVLLQVSLFIVFLSLLTYLIVPMDYAHPIVFLLLCGGIAVGIFLVK
jgi:hypothetical protein